MYFGCKYHLTDCVCTVSCALFYLLWLQLGEFCSWTSWLFYLLEVSGLRKHWLVCHLHTWVTVVRHRNQPRQEDSQQRSTIFELFWTETGQPDRLTNIYQPHVYPLAVHLAHSKGCVCLIELAPVVSLIWSSNKGLTGGRALIGAGAALQ